MDLLQLQYCIEAEKSLSFSKVAETCHVSQSVISVQIGKLENEFGIRIFLRTPKGVAITPEGEQFLIYAKRIIAIDQQMRQAIRAMKMHRTSRISIGLAQCSTSYLLTNRVALFQTQNPHTEIDIQEGYSKDLLMLLRAQALDAAFLSGASLPADLKTYELIRDEVVLVVKNDHPLAQRESISVDDLQGESLLFSDNSSIMQALLKTKQAMEASRRGETYFNISTTKNAHVFTNISMVANGIASTLVTHNSAMRFPGRITMVKLNPPIYHYVYLAVSDDKENNEQIEKFIKFNLSFPYQA